MNLILNANRKLLHSLFSALTGDNSNEKNKKNRENETRKESHI